jgi:hypothetical protein
MKNRFAGLLPMLAALGLAVAASGQSAPDFSGTWVLNTAKGKNIGMMAAVQETIVVRQSADTLTVESTSTFQGNTTKRTVNYDLKGNAVDNEGAMGGKAETVAKWDGDKLVVTWTSEGAIAGTKVVRTETRSLAADGRTMTVVSQRGDNPAMEMVYEKK